MTVTKNEKEQRIPHSGTQYDTVAQESTTTDEGGRIPQWHESNTTQSHNVLPLNKQNWEGRTNTTQWHESSTIYYHWTGKTEKEEWIPYSGMKAIRHSRTMYYWTDKTEKEERIPHSGTKTIQHSRIRTGEEGRIPHSGTKAIRHSRIRMYYNYTTERARKDE